MVDRSILSNDEIGVAGADRIAALREIASSSGHLEAAKVLAEERRAGPESIARNAALLRKRRGGDCGGEERDRESALHRTTIDCRSEPCLP